MILRGTRARCRKCRSTRVTGWKDLWDRKNLLEDGTPAFIGLERKCRACGDVERKA